MSRTSALSGVFFLSGAAALGLQMVWTKMFAAGLGHEVPAMLAVVSAFLAGMAFGGWMLDHHIAAAPNPARWYAGLQLVVGGWALVATLAIPALNHLALALIGVTPDFARQSFVSFALPFLALLPATMAMGATLPAMDRSLATLVADRRCVGRVYALNTAGAVGGTLAAAFLLMPALGFRASAMTFAGINLLCGVIALSRRFALRGASSPRPSPPSDGGEGVRGSDLGSELGWHVLLPAFVTGLLGIGYEFVGVRVLAQALENTIYTFASALAVYLLGTALGAALYQRFARARPFRPILAALLCSQATVGVSEVWVMSHTLGIHDALRARVGDSMGGVLLADMMVTLLVFGPPTVLMGATFSHLVQGAKGANGGVGRASGLNTLGGALAGVVFGLVLLPALGARWTLVVLALTYLALLPLVWPRRTFFSPNLLGVALPLALVFLPSDLRLIRLPPQAMIRDYREGTMAGVAVLQTPDGHRSLRVNNRFQMGGTAAALAQRREAHLPLLLHPAPRRALFLGPGTGITLGAARAHAGLQTDGVELVPEVIELMHHFEPENQGPFHLLNGRRPDKASGSTGQGASASEAFTPSLACADARRFVRTTRQQYDVIVADLFHPAQDGAGFLYTREHFTAIRARLAAGGLFCQWLPLHQLDESTLRSIVGTFLEVFPQAHAFLLHFNVDIPVLGLIGTLEPLRVSADAVEHRLGNPDVRSALKAAGLDRTLNLLGCAVAGPKQLRSFSLGAPLNTDDHPVVTFAAPYLSARHGSPYEVLLDLLAHWKIEPSELLGPERSALAAQLADFVAARDLYLRGLATEAGANLSEAINVYLEAARRSLFFTPAYARLVNIIQVLAATDRPAARRLFERLEAAQPAQPLGRQLLGPLLGQP